MSLPKLAAQANLLQQVKARSAGRSHKRNAEKDRDWQRKQQRLMRNKT